MCSAWVGGSKTPPYSVHAEKTLLGAIIVEPKLLAEVAPIIAAGDAFFRSQHGQIYDVMLAMAPGKRAPDLAALAESLTERGVLDAIGGQAFLIDLAAGAGRPAEALEHARQIQEKALLRRLIDAASDTLTEAYRGELGFDELLKRARGRLERLTDDSIAPAAPKA